MQRLATALALSPDSGEIMAAAAETYEIVGQRERAIELARDALEWFVAAAGVLSG
jgi:hypothetical protein